MKRMYMVALMALVAGMSFPVPAMAVLDVSLDFSTLPITNGPWSKVGATDPEATINLGTGIWNNNMSASLDGLQSSGFGYSAILDDNPISGGATYIHGEAEISHTTISSDVRGNDLTLAMWNKSGDWTVRLHAKPNVIRVVQLGDQNNFAEVPVDNTGNLGSALHKYGWDLNLSTNMLRVYFDGALVGDPGGYDVNNPGAGNGLSIGDISGGGNSKAHNEDWHSWHVGEGAIPEPAPLTLLGLGGGLMLLRRRA